MKKTKYDLLREIALLKDTVKMQREIITDLLRVSNKKENSRETE